MLCNTFKETKPLDLDRGIKNYIAKHYDYGNFDKVYQFNSIIANTRGVIANLHTFESSFDKLSSSKDTIVLYMNMLNLLRSKFNFGSDEVLDKIYYNMLFNLI